MWHIVDQIVWDYASAVIDINTDRAVIDNSTMVNVVIGDYVSFLTETASDDPTTSYIKYFIAYNFIAMTVYFNSISAYVFNNVVL